jgi:hypothetical protein
VETDAARAARLNAEREDEIRRVPLQTIDKSKWPKDVRPIGMGEADGLALQLRFLKGSESMGNHDSNIVDACCVD